MKEKGNNENEIAGRLIFRFDLDECINNRNRKCDERKNFEDGCYRRMVVFSCPEYDVQEMKNNSRKKKRCFHGFGSFDPAKKSTCICPNRAEIKNGKYYLYYTYKRAHIKNENICLVRYSKHRPFSRFE